MLGIDVALLAGAALALAVVSGLLGQRLARSREEERRRKQGEKNAAEEKRRQAELCVECGLQVEPAVDLWDQGHWWHRDCWRKVVETPP